VLQCAAACCSVLQCAAVCCSALQCGAVCISRDTGESFFCGVQCVALKSCALCAQCAQSAPNGVHMVHLVHQMHNPCHSKHFRVSRTYTAHIKRNPQKGSLTIYICAHIHYTHICTYVIPGERIHELHNPCHDTLQHTMQHSETHYTHTR